MHLLNLINVTKCIPRNWVLYKLEIYKVLNLKVRFFIVTAQVKENTYSNFLLETFALSLFQWFLASDPETLELHIILTVVPQDC